MGCMVAAILSMTVLASVPRHLFSEHQHLCANGLAAKSAKGAIRGR